MKGLVKIDKDQADFLLRACEAVRSVVAELVKLECSDFKKAKKFLWFTYYVNDDKAFDEAADSAFTFTFKWMGNEPRVSTNSSYDDLLALRHLLRVGGDVYLDESLSRVANYLTKNYGSK